MHDQEFLRQFETLTLAKSEFSHQGHLRIAWLYLGKNTFEQAVYQITHGIRRYAAHLGAAHIYHETLTKTWIHLVRAAMIIQTHKTFEEFLLGHPHLQNKALPFQYYSEALLQSEAARKQWIEPDLKSLP
ncbi:hypothetical protein AQUSIP_15770 [Aquicella siphonis]|uniref:Uncharacterized protein n=1 Tax=Aquicella siphonis TaxID=254247 RepID=A0A5E4PIJ1_9COXI|nr:hypothetical protein [Aquicella siphonis]VVC76268.1 hypothetical protein AQUSIP_15770 [Aquicella siphonis]